MKKLKYVGKHMPVGVYEIEDHRAKELLKLSEWVEEKESPKKADKKQ